MMQITIPKNEYDQLKRQAKMLRQFASQFFALAIEDPIDDVVVDFKKTRLYSDAFLNDLESGLRRSSFAKKYAHSAASRRSRAVSSRS